VCGVQDRVDASDKWAPRRRKVDEIEASVFGAQHAAPLHVHAFIANNLKWRAVIQWWFLG